MLTFRAISTSSTGVTFAQIDNPDHLLKIGASRQNINRNGVTQPLVRVAAVLSLPLHASDPGCADGCATKGVFTRSIRIETSSIASDKATLLADLELLVATLKGNNGSVFDGFTPPAGTDIIYAPVV